MGNFIKKHLARIGYFQFSKETIVYAFKKESGIRWFFIRSIISLDISGFSDNRLITAEFLDRKNLPALYIEHIHSLPPKASSEDLMAIYVSICQTLLRPIQVIQLMNFPIAHRCLYNLPNFPLLAPPVRIDGNLVECILSMLEQQSDFPIYFFNFFFCVALTRNQRFRVQELLHPKTPLAAAFFRSILPIAFFFTDGQELVVDDTARAFLQNKPPSFSLAFYRSIVGLFAPAIPQTFIAEIENFLTPVHPEFGYIGLSTWDNATDVTKILSGLIIENPFVELKHPGREAIAVYNALQGNAQFQEKNAATRAILELAVDTRATPVFALGAISAILKWDPGMAGLIAEEHFVNAPNFLNVCLIVARVSKLTENANIVERAQAALADEGRKTLLGLFGDRADLGQLIHAPTRQT
jgi:hypothetical protein